MSNIFWSAAFSAWCASYSPTSSASPAELQSEIRPTSWWLFQRFLVPLGSYSAVVGTASPCGGCRHRRKSGDQDLEGPEGRCTLWISNFGRKMKAGDYKWNKYSQIVYKTIFKRFTPPAKGIPVHPRESHQGAQTYSSCGLHQHPLCPRHLAPLKLYHKTVRLEEKATLEKKC